VSDRFLEILEKPVRTGFFPTEQSFDHLSSEPQPGAANGIDWGRNYNRRVARGWESKSVEAQQAEAGEPSAKARPRMSAAEAACWREKENLRLSRQRVLKQLDGNTNPRHRRLLEEALADLDQKLQALEK
jgi:hypothetical protein